MSSSAKPPKSQNIERATEMLIEGLPLEKLRAEIQQKTFKNIWEQAEGQVSEEMFTAKRLGYQEALKTYSEEELAELRTLALGAEGIDFRKLEENNASEGVQDFAYLLKKHGQRLSPEKRDELVRVLSRSGLRWETNKKTGKFEKVYLSEPAQKSGLDAKSLESLQSDFDEQDYLSFTEDITVLEAKHRKRIILNKVIGTEEGKAALLNNELSPEKVAMIAENMAQHDEEMKNDLQLLTEANKKIETLEDKKAENDIKKTRETAPEKFSVLEEIFLQNKKNEIEMTKALHRNHYSLENCRTEGGRLYLNIEGIRLAPPKIDITLNGFKVQNEDFSFDLDAAVKAVRGREEIEKWVLSHNLDKEKNEWLNYEDKYFKAAKLYRIAEEMPFMLLGFSKLGLKDRFDILISHIAVMSTREFNKFVDVIKKIEDLKQIRENRPLKNMLQSMKFSEKSLEAPAEGLS